MMGAFLFSGAREMGEVVDIVVHFDFRDTTFAARYKGEAIPKPQHFMVTGVIGGVDFIFTICNYFKYERQLLISRLAAERILKDIGTAIPDLPPVVSAVRGRSMVNGLPVTLEVTDGDIHSVISNDVSSFRRAVDHFRKYDLPESFRSFQQRLILEGEFSTLHRLDEALREWTGLEVIVRSELTL
jgi:rod shape-determining protein MreB and related proteins